MGDRTESNTPGVIWPEKYNNNTAVQNDCPIGLLHKITLLFIAAAMDF